MTTNFFSKLSPADRTAIYCKFNPDHDWICQRLNKALQALEEKLNAAANGQGFFGRAQINEKAVLGEKDYNRFKRLPGIIAAREKMLNKRKHLVLNILGWYN